jgi:hypothetical protein
MTLFGILMARGAMRAMNAALPPKNPFRRYTRAQEAIFWIVVIAGGYGIYSVLMAI